MSDGEVREAYSSRAVEYTQLLGSVDQMHESDRQTISRWAEHITVGRVLDAGCGPGHWTASLRAQGLDAEGIDLVPEFIDHARTTFPGVGFRVASLAHIDVEDGSLAGVLAWYSLIHAAPEEVPAVLDEFHRILRAGGALLVGFFNGVTGERFAHAVTDAYYWSIRSMAHLLDEAGFDIAETQTRQDPGRRPHAAISAVARSLRNGEHRSHFPCCGRPLYDPPSRRVRRRETMSAKLETPLVDFGGEIITPDSIGYPEASRTALGDGNPAVILCPVDTTDVQRAVRFAVASGRELAIRGGGHSAAGFSTVDGGTVIDLRALDTVELRDGNRVRVGGGATWRHVVDALTPHGLGISSGDTADVGVGGLTLSGGIGWMVRQHGLTLDHLRAVEVVTASGDVFTADADHHADLFWALRGGGGAYGVVTAFEFEAQEMATAAIGTLTFPAEEAERVVLGWTAHMRGAPHAISSTLTLANALAGGRQAPVSIVLVRCDGDELESKMSELSALGTVLSAEERRVPYAEILHAGAELPRGLRASVRNAFVGPKRADAAAKAIARIAGEEQPATIVVHSLGGAFGQIAADATAFAHRHAELMITTFAVGPDTATGAIRTRLQEVWHKLAPFGEGVYANSLDGASGEAIAAIYPQRTRARLAEIKARYDPDNLFTRNFGPRAVTTR